MKNKYLLFLLFSILFFSFTKSDNKIIIASLIDLQFYSVSECQNESSIYVRVIYKVEYNNLSSLKIRNKFSNNICTTIPVKEKDKKGNIVYSFCSNKGENIWFTSTFISPNGLRSKEIKVNINFSDVNIISGTAPKTIKLY